MIYCGVFDGHGPSGHKVARHIRDNLPSKLSSSLKGSEEIDESNKDSENVDSKEGNDKDNSQSALFSSWRDHIIKSFKEMDEELGADSSIDSYCSGTTSVSMLKKVHFLASQILFRSFFIDTSHEKDNSSSLFFGFNF